MTAADLLAWLQALGEREDLAVMRVRIEVSDSYYDKDLISEDQLAVVDRFPKHGDPAMFRTLIIHGD